MRRRKSTNLLWVVAVIIAAGAHQAWKAAQDTPVAAPTPAERKTFSKTFDTLTGARLHDDRNNDGDSFKIFHQGSVHEFRLYFVDCPEKRRHQYNGDRLRDQGRYFGGLNEAQTTAIGQKAQAFSKELMTNQKYVIHTKWEKVYDSGRYYAFVVFDDGEDLSVKLVRAGLVRIHTGGAALPDGRAEKTYRDYLRQVEKEARAARAGAWALAGAKLN